ncbi:hypothetical protein ACS0TY_015603 [Phlomoides rotata]
MELKPLPLHHNIPAPPPYVVAHDHRHGPFAFYWGKEAQFLFSGWPDNHSGMYALALVFVFFLAMFVEFLTNLNLVKPGSNRAATVSFQAGFVAVRAGFSYMVMLSVMSYNGGVFIAAILGHAVGYVIFGSKISKSRSP